MLVSVTPVARSVPHDPIDGLEVSQDTQKALEQLMKLFRYVEKEPTGMPNKYSDSVIDFSNTGKSFSISPLSGSFDFYIRGKEYTVSTTLTYVLPTVANPADNEGVWFFYFTDAGLQGSQTVWDLRSPLVPLANGYWDSTNQVWIRENEERHGVTMDFDTHRLLHRTEGSKVEQEASSLVMLNYTTSGDGSMDVHAQYGISDGVFFDEDISIDIKHAAVPVNHFEQYLRPYASLPGFYLSGVDYWRKKTATSFPVYNNTVGTCSYNYWNGSAWQLQPCTNGYFFATWLVYTDDVHEPVIWLLGQREDPDLISAVNNNTRLGNPLNGLPGLSIPRKFSEEFYFYKKLIWETSTSFTNTPRARLRYVAATSEIVTASDRYAMIGSYNGNAANRYLEFYPGQGSDTAPFPIPELSYLRTIALRAVANSTGTVSIYKYPDFTNAITSISLSNSMYAKKFVTIQLNPDEFLTAKVTQGSINKPALTMWIQTSV